MKYFYLPIVFVIAVCYSSFFDSKKANIEINNSKSINTERSPASIKDSNRMNKIQKFFCK
jgi:hypothetical protein